MNTAARKYRPRISTLMNLCEVNYMLMLRVLADKENEGEQRCFFISDFLSYTVKINEVTRYTSLVTISQDINASFTTNSPNKSSNELALTHLLQPRMVMRLYHDARVAEVISSQDIHHVKPRNDYPNDLMHLPDEKQQINHFLKEWLQLCFELGQVKLTLR
ncbi:MAG: hypothetical protein ACI9LM_000698 [Alteromonadaceae bacterium]|jgi:uncharacterized protein YqiB (DUF1249 family)